MENFSLFNLLRALGGANAGADGGESAADKGNESHAGGETPRTNGAPHAAESEDGAQKTGGAKSPSDMGGQTNVLAEVLERHEKISNRIKSKTYRPPHGR